MGAVASWELQKPINYPSATPIKEVPLKHDMLFLLCICYVFLLVLTWW